MDKAIEITGHAYEADGGSHDIRVQDTTTLSHTHAAVKAFARYCRAVQDGELTNFYVKTPDGCVVWYLEPVTDLQRAIDMVRDDQRASDFDLSARQAVVLARSNVSPAELDPSDALNFAAYHLVLTATQTEIDEAFEVRTP